MHSNWQGCDVTMSFYSKSSNVARVFRGFVRYAECSVKCTGIQVKFNSFSGPSLPDDEDDVRKFKLSIT